MMLVSMYVGVSCVGTMWPFTLYLVTVYVHTFVSMLCSSAIEQGSGSAMRAQPDDGTSFANNSISVPGRAFENITTDQIGTILSFYKSSVLFPLRLNQTQERGENSSYKEIGSSVISATVAGKVIVNLKDPVNISLGIFTVVGEIR